MAFFEEQQRFSLKPFNMRVFNKLLKKWQKAQEVLRSPSS
jgi:hypothetical protein